MTTANTEDSYVSKGMESTYVHCIANERGKYKQKATFYSTLSTNRYLLGKGSDYRRKKCIETKLTGFNNIFEETLHSAHIELEKGAKALRKPLRERIYGMFSGVVQDFDDHFYDNEEEAQLRKNHQAARTKLLDTVKEQQRIIDGPLQIEMQKLSQFT